MTPDDFDELDALFDDLRTRDDEAPQWEFCEGFIAALASCRRPIDNDEALAELLDFNPPTDGAPPVPFASVSQYQRFLTLWDQRLAEVRQALATPIESLDDEQGYQPEVMDLRGAVAALPAAQRAEMGDAPVPSFGQIWALGFMYAVESWPQDWAAPRDRELAKVIDSALQCIVALTEDDDAPATVCAFEDGGVPSMSQQRLDAYADAVWAVYDLHEAWQTLGPRVATVVVGDKTGRNDPCPCGSGKKFKKCCGT